MKKQMNRTLSILLAVVLLLGCLTGLASAESTYTREQKQQMLVQTALAYYYHNPYVQYDGRDVVNNGSVSRHDDHGAPEDAAVDSQVYSVCSNYCYKVYEETFGFKLYGMSYAQTKNWAARPQGDKTIVYQYKGNGGEKDVNKALEESRKLLQPGDIICGYGTSGHAMLFVGDCVGDGKEYILHCWGSSHDMEKGTDPVEADGSIVLQLVDECCYQKGFKPSWYLASDAHSSLGFAILRPLDDPNIPDEPTPAAISRLQYPGLAIYRDLDRIKFKAAHTGDEIPVTVTITNNGTTNYTGLPIEEYLPEGQTLVEGSATDAKIDGTTLRWSLDVPAGQTKKVSYKVKLNAKLGETVEFPEGKVANIASRGTSLVIGGKDFTEEQHKKLAAYAETLNNTTAVPFKDLKFLNTFYEDALGIHLNLPAKINDFLDKLTVVQIDSKHSDKCAYRKELKKIDEKDLYLNRMIMPLHFTGRYVENDRSNWSRVRDYNEAFYEPGDMFIILKGKNINRLSKNQDACLYVYLGDSKVLVYDTEGDIRVTQFGSTIGLGLGYNMVIALRPTLAYEDINTVEKVVPEVKLTFTDVTEKDWFYTYVKDLVADGTVAGVSATSFAPKSNLTYGQALKLVTMAVGAGEQEPVDGGHWASGYQKYAIRQKWMDKTVDLNANITRLQFCQIAAKAKNLTEQPASNPFKDCSDPAVLALNKAGVIDGISEGTFAPDNLLTRAQITKIIWCLQDIK